MNIKMQSINLLSNNGLKSTQDRLDRQAKRDSQIAFFEQQKENLKNMKADSIEDISRKLELLHGYDDQITAAKAEYNNSQMFHILDEARERAEKIAEEAEKYAPKTPEERLEDMIEEATGTDENEGMMSEMLEELSDAAEEMQEALEENMEKNTETLEENLSEMVTEAELVPDGAGVTAANVDLEDDSNIKLYKKIDVYV